MKSKLELPNAGTLMNRKVHSVTADLSLAELIDFLLKHEISSAPVVETKGSKKFLIGFISESDALEHLSNEMFYGFPVQPRSVETCMKRHPIAITEDVDLFAIGSLLVNHGYRHLPVVDEDNQLLGIVSRRDVLKPMKTFYTGAIRKHDAEYFPPDVKKIINHRFIVGR
jgi:CBS domain-containing protein